MKDLQHLFNECPLFSVSTPKFLSFLFNRFITVPLEQLNHKDFVLNPDSGIISELGIFVQVWPTTWDTFHCANSCLSNGVFLCSETVLATE